MADGMQWTVPGMMIKMIKREPSMVICILMCQIITVMNIASGRIQQKAGGAAIVFRSVRMTK